MSFTSAQMETAWDGVMSASGEIEWIDIISTTTGEFYRLSVTNGLFRHWNRVTGGWESVALPPNLITGFVRSR